MCCAPLLPFVLPTPDIAIVVLAVYDTNAALPNFHKVGRSEALKGFRKGLISENGSVEE